MTALPTAPLRAIHAALMDDIALLRRQVWALPGLEAQAAEDVMNAVKGFILESIRPRAEWEEAVLYPAIDAASAATDPPLTATMRREHQFVGAWMAELHGFRSADPPDLVSFARVADNMLSFIHAHFVVQEEVLLPVLDRSMSADEFQREILDRPR